MRAKLAAGVALCAACICGAAEAQTPRPAKPGLEGLWSVNFLLPMEATPETPKLVVPEGEAKALAAVIGNEISTAFEMMLDPEFPELVRHADGLAVVRGERRTRAVVLPADGRLPYT